MKTKKLKTMGDVRNGIYYDATMDELIEIWNVDQQEKTVALNFATEEMSDFIIAPKKDRVSADVFYIGEY